VPWRPDGRPGHGTLSSRSSRATGAAGAAPRSRWPLPPRLPGRGSGHRPAAIWIVISPAAGGKPALRRRPWLCKPGGDPRKPPAGL